MDREKLQALAAERGTILVEFYATWCPHCQRMAPVVADVEALLGDKAKVYQLDIDRNQDLADQLRVDSTPTFIIFRDGEEMWRQAGEMDGNVLYQQVMRYV